MDDKNLAATITKITEAQAAQRTLNAQGLHAVVLPTGYGLYETEHLHESPSRIREHLDAEDIIGFVNYVKRFSRPDTTVGFIQRHGTRRGLYVVFDYHAEGNPEWCSHSVSFRPVESREKKLWEGAATATYTQEQFADFIEQNMHHFVSPDGATLAELVMHFEATRNVTFSSGVNLSNGSRELVYTDVAGKGSGKIKVPEKITIRIPLFRGAEPVDLKFRFMYTVGPEGLRIRIKPISLLDAMDKAFEQIVVDVQKRIMGQIPPPAWFSKEL